MLASLTISEERAEPGSSRLKLKFCWLKTMTGVVDLHKYAIMSHPFYH